MPDTQLIDLPSSVCAFLVIPILVYNVGLRVVWLTFWFVIEKGHAFAWRNRLDTFESNDNELVDKINFYGLWNFQCNDIENCRVKHTSSEEVYSFGRHVFDWVMGSMYMHKGASSFVLRNCMVGMISSQYTCHIISSYWYHYMRYFAKVGLLSLELQQENTKDNRKVKGLNGVVRRMNKSDSNTIMQKVIITHRNH